MKVEKSLIITFIVLLIFCISKLDDASRDL